MGTKSRNAKKGMSRGRGASRGGRGRGGRGGSRGGRSGVPTSYGYATQQPTSFKYMDELYGDFKVYGQFGSESDDDISTGNAGRRGKSKKPSKKTTPSARKANPSQFAYSYKSDEEDRPAAVGLGYTSLTAASTSSAPASFGRSKYTKMMVFQKSTMVLNHESDINSDKAIESTTSGISSPGLGQDGAEKSTDNNADVEDNSSSDDELDDTALENVSNEQDIDDLLASLTLQDPELQRVVQKLTRKERREQRYQELMGISNSDTESDDDLVSQDVEYEDDIFLSGDDEVEDEDEIAAMLDYIENASLNDDGEDELRAYYQTLVKKLSSMDKKLEKEESVEKRKGERNGQNKAATKLDHGLDDGDVENVTKEKPYVQPTKSNDDDNHFGSPPVTKYTVTTESEVLLEPYSDEEEHIISTATSAAKRNILNDKHADALSEEESSQEEEGDDDYLDEEEDESEDELYEFDDDEEQLEDDAIYQEYEESDLDDVEEEDGPLIFADDDDDEPIIIEATAVPPSLQRGYNALSKYNAREARQRRMLKTEAFEVESTSHLTDKQRRKLEKKQERERKKEKNMTTKKQKKMMKEMDENVDLRKIDQKLQQFIRDDSISSYQMAPMAKYTRRQVHLLATAYNLKSKSLGSGNSRYPVLSKTERTFIPNDRKYIERFIAEAQSTLDITSSILRKHRMPYIENSIPSKSKRKAGKKEAGRNGSSPSDLPGPSHGHIVAGNAAPINDQNIGHQMLAAMGWKQGDSLGTEGTGITVPIEAIVRKKRIGLGM
ncbi:hypothetical protein K450DRAFT_222485 [Umbelopsis ramanniana AG]|uniref:Protein SQS1 n=1 Tax=Umbelopsis ramanniana AG TaxID=1314678 RepID=A0AAD5HIJ2_UMBRA|nr:uncharacterized protein K450DRAFT_222485 [Umbelopsis ramanniana AG]KAI8583726.1 hypothetical protein K450DRAFT_222485 [Umbelopsis ramanniana AG]